MNEPGLILFGERVRALRQERGLSQERLADMSGLHRTYIGAVERGSRNISLRNILKVAEALGVPPAALLSEKEALGEER